jgi:signal transduction histidine kinase
VVVIVYSPHRLLVTSALFAGVTGWFALAGTWRGYPLAGVTAVLVSAALLAAGARLQNLPRSKKIGASLLIGGALWPGCWSGIGQAGIGPWCGWADQNVIWLVLATGLLSYPDQQPFSRAQRRFLVVLWAFVLSALVVLPLVSRPEWLALPADAWWPSLHASHTTFTFAMAVFAVGRFASAVVGSVLLVTRLRGASGLDRSLLTPTVVGVLALVLVVNISGAYQAASQTEAAMVAALTAQGIALLLFPAMVLVAAIRTRLARAEMVDLLMRRTGPPDAEFVQSALRTALHDGSVELMLWTGEQEAYVDPSGRAVSWPPPNDRYRAPLVGTQGQHLGMMTGDPRLGDHQPLVEAAINAAGIELEVAALTMNLRTNVEQLRSSRDRVVAAGKAERRRLARDLHDGVQQRMLAIGLRLEHMHNQASEPAVQRSLEKVKAEMQQALAEIREVAHGVRPSVLVDGGLRPALQAVTDGMPMPVDIDVPSQRFAQEAESTAYFVANEALTNIVKHSAASHAEVSVHEVEGHLWVEITDDGVGGDGRPTGIRTARPF